MSTVGYICSFLDLMKSELIMSIIPTSMESTNLDMGNDRFQITEHSILPKTDACADNTLNSTSEQEHGLPSIVIIDDNGITKVDELLLDNTTVRNQADINSTVDTKQSNNEQASLRGAEKCSCMIKSDEGLNLISNLYDQRRGSTSSRSSHHVTFSLSHENGGNIGDGEINNNQNRRDDLLDISCDSRAGPRKVLKTIEVLGIRTTPPDQSEKHTKHKKTPVGRQLPKYKRLRQMMKMEENQRSNSNPDELHFTLDETASEGRKLRRSCSLKQNGSVSRVSVAQSLPQSLEDISTQHLIRANSTDNSDDERCSSRRHAANHGEADTIWSHRPSEFRIRDQLFSFFQASDNKLAMKLFGSRNALLKEKQRQMAAKSWIIHPCSNFR